MGSYVANLWRYICLKVSRIPDDINKKFRLHINNSLIFKKKLKSDTVNINIKQNLCNKHRGHGAKFITYWKKKDPDKEKKDINVQNNNPLADILLIRFTEFCFFLDETKNCKTAKNRDSQRVEFPKNADIY